MADLKIVNLSGQYPYLQKGTLSGPPQGLVVHHTASADNATPQSIAAGWKTTGTSAQYIMGRDGTIYQMVPDGGKAYQIKASWNPAIPWASNSTTQGIELIAKDDKDVTPAQTAALQKFALQQAQTYGYDPGTHVIGHGEVNGSAGLNGKTRADGRPDNEGMTAVAALRASLNGKGPNPLPPMNVPQVGTALAYTGDPPPLPRPDPRTSALDAISAAQNPASYGNNAADKLFQNQITTADFGLADGTKSFTPQFDAQGTIGRDGQISYSLPGAEPYGGYIPGFDGGGGTLPSSVPLPRVDPRLTPVSPLPRTPLQTPIPSTPVPTQIASAAPQEAKPTVNINGHNYTVGQVLTNPSNGLSYVVNANGTMTKQPHISLGTNTVASGIAGKAVESAIQNAQAAAPAALASAGGAISGLFGNLFGGGKPVPPMDVPVNTTSSVPQTTGPAGGYYSPPRSSVPQSSGPAGGYYSPPTMPQATANGIDAKAEVADRAQQLAQYNLANQPSYTTPTGYGGYIPGGSSPVPLASPNAVTLPTPAPKYTTQTVVNPAYTAWLNNQAPVTPSVPQSYGPAGGYYSTPYDDLVSKPVTPAPQHYIQKTVPVSPVPQVAPVVPLSPDPSELAALREQAMNPFQRFYGATPLGHITNFLSGGTQGYGAPQQSGLLGLLGNFLQRPSTSAASAPHVTLPANNVGALGLMGLSPAQAQAYASGGAAAQAANPNPIMGAITGALNPQYGSIAAPSSGSVISPFHSF